MLYHLTEDRLFSRDLRNDREIPTLYGDNAPLRINRYSNGVGNGRHAYIPKHPREHIQVCSGQNQSDNFGKIFETKAYRGNSLKEKSSLEYCNQLPFRYFANNSLFPDYCQKYHISRR